MDYPAITICSQGLISRVLTNALKYQKDQFAKENNLNKNLTVEELEELWKKAMYPGLSMTPEQLVKLTASPNPEVTVQSQVLLENGFDPCDNSSAFSSGGTEVEAVTCPDGWAQSTLVPKHCLKLMRTAATDGGE